MKKLKCSICEKFISINVFNYHLHSKHKLEYNICKNIKLNLIANKELQNDIINDYLNLQLCFKTISKNRNILISEIILILIQNNIKLRNSKEAHNTEDYKNNMQTSIKTKYGVDNISQCEEIKKKKIETMLKNHGRINNFQDSNIQQKAENNMDREKAWESIKQSLIIKYGVDNVAKINYVKEKISNSHKENCFNMSEDEKREMTARMRCKIKGWTSKLELRIQEILNLLNISYSNNKYLFGYNYDILFENKYILEIQGDFWHANPKKYKAEDILNFPKIKKKAKDIWNYDLKKRKAAEKNNHKVIYLWEEEINNMNDIQIMNFILNILNYGNKRNKNS